MSATPSTTPTPEPSCGACAFWDSRRGLKGGLCRRWGPDRIAITDGVAGSLYAASGWPTTGPGDWCGEFEAADPPVPPMPTTP